MKTAGSAETSVYSYRTKWRRFLEHVKLCVWCWVANWFFYGRLGEVRLGLVRFLIDLGANFGSL